MKLDRLNSWLTLAANVGVIAGIIFLGLEIQQNTNVLIANSRQAALDNSLQTLYYESAHPDLGLSLVKPVLSDAEKVTLSAFLFSVARRGEVAWQQYQAGASDEQGWLGVRGALLGNIQYVQGRRWWEHFDSQSLFDPTYSQQINQLLSDMPIKTELDELKAFE